MTYEWEPGTYYGEGSVVEYQGHKYKIIQPHTSQGDWTPPATPALWGRLPEDYHHEEHHEEHRQESGYNPSYNQDGGSSNEKHETVIIHEEERKTGWDALSDERKHQIEVGGGLVAGALALGAGFFAWNEHKKSEEEKKQHMWDLSNWLRDAEIRTRDFYGGRVSSPVTWVLVEGKNIPTDIAIVGGEEHGTPHYICRGWHEGSLQIGKASSIFQKGGVVGYAHSEHHLGKFEVLVGDKRAVRWVDFHGRCELDKLPGRPVEGGREADGSPLFIAKGVYNKAIVPGKCGPKLPAAFVPYANSEKEVKDYSILCYV
ncbi:hypothetical protein BD311DRAFT_767899 [Dichomitus squalens]|uniref:Chitin-binding type-3 domain-containing protein n=1 Tax=Dichomitus squalens TaxID=114155 RepID=A0A4Q9MD49_9APHY|nr:hypothetical protein BD311DRAFT_767899 [Dichomitus squalens]TBU59249.1 hypothetical protein BD310DRAFT_976792 [Dichomitus squalens]